MQLLWQLRLSLLTLGVAATAPAPADPTFNAVKTAGTTRVRWAAGSGFVVFDPPTASIVGLEHVAGMTQQPHDVPPPPPITVDGSGCHIFTVRMWPSQGQPFGNASNPADGWEVSESVPIQDARWQLLANGTVANEFVYRDSVSGLVATLKVVAVSGSPLELTVRLHNPGSTARYVAELEFPPPSSLS
jgi:hypothetical protein